jgi:hypothetical protein
MFGISEWQIKKRRRRRRRSIFFLLDIYYSKKKTEFKSAKIKCFFRFSIAINVQPKFEKFFFSPPKFGDSFQKKKKKNIATEYFDFDFHTNLAKLHQRKKKTEEEVLRLTWV